MNQTHISKSTIFGITIIVIVYMNPNIGGWSCQNPCSSSPRQLPPSSATLSYDQSHLLGALVVCGSLYASNESSGHWCVSGIWDATVHSQCSSYLWKIHQFDHLELYVTDTDIRCEVHLHKPIIWGPSCLMQKNSHLGTQSSGLQLSGHKFCLREPNSRFASVPVHNLEIQFSNIRQLEQMCHHEGGLADNLGPR